jgi:hypothetical protein
MTTLYGLEVFGVQAKAFRFVFGTLSNKLLPDFAGKKLVEQVKVRR